jgi:glycosyltransferase involved in cell wall biosynthesis
MVVSMPSFRRAVRAARLILATNYETKRLLEKAGAQTVQLFPDLGISEAQLYTGAAPGRRGPLVLHWSGRLEARKAPRLAIEAVATSAARGVDVRLEISGDGPERSRCEVLAKQLNVWDRVSFLGFVPRNEVLARFRQASALLMTSVRDTFGSVVLEAASQGLPAIALDHQGIKALVPANAGWKVPVTTPQDTVAGIAAAIEDISSDPAGRDRRAAEALKFATANTWERRAEQMEQFYNEYRH